MRSVHYIKIQGVPINIKVKKECAGAERFNEIFLAGSTINMLKGDSCSQ